MDLAQTRPDGTRLRGLSGWSTRRRRRVAAFAALVMIPLAGRAGGPASATVQNLLTVNQQSFESSLAGWRSEAGAISRVSTYAYSGNYSMRINANNLPSTPADIVATTTTGTGGVPATPGAGYTGSIRVRSGGAALRSARCELRWYGSTGAHLATTSGTTATEVSQAWKNLTCAGTAPAGTARMALAVRFFGVPSREQHYVDDAWLTPATAPTTTSTTAPAPSFSYRAAAGSSTGVTASGVAFGPDRDYLGGSAWGPSDSAIDGTDMDLLYQNNRWGMTGYAVAVPASGTYTVRLHFAEVVMASAGRRVFDVLAEGAVRVNDLDVYGRVGPARALVEQFAVTVTDGTLNLGFQAVVEDPMVSGVEVVGGTATTTTIAPATTTTSAPSPTTTVPKTTTTAPAPTTTVPATTTTVAPRPSGAMPTAANTGPITEPTQAITSDQAVAARGASNKIINGGVFVQDWGGSYLGTTWNFTDCVMKGSFYFLIDNGSASYPLSQYPTINITRCRIEGSFIFIGAAKVNIDDTYVTLGAGMITPCPDCAGSTYGLVREMPWMVTNSLFRSLPGNPAIGEHTEAMHIAGTGQGFQFVNTRFIQEGPVNGTQTGALFMHAGRSTFDGCYFDDGDQGISNAYYYTVYAYGTGPGATQNVFKNSAIERGMSDYVYPDQPSDPVIHATYTNNRDFHTGAPLTLP